MMRSLSLVAVLTACGGGSSHPEDILAPAAAADQLACQATLRVWEQNEAADVQVSADDLNRGGALCLSAGDPKTALVLLAQAVDHNPRHALAHLNRARAIAAVRSTEDEQTACDLDATSARLVAHLQAVHRLDPDRLSAATDLPDPIRALPPVRLLLDGETDPRRRTVLAVQGAHFTTTGPGGALAVALQGEAPHNNLDHALPAEVRWGAGSAGTGGWAVDERGQVLLDPDGPGPQPVQVLLLTEQGTLLDAASSQVWTSIPDPCAS